MIAKFRPPHKDTGAILKVAARRGVRLQGRDDLQKAVAQGEDCVAQPELRDTGVAKRLAEAERIAQLALDGLKLGGDQHGLAEADAGCGRGHEATPMRQAARGASSSG